MEIIGEDGELERKADMFSKRTIKPHTPVTSVDTASEVTGVCGLIVLLENISGCV